MEPFACDALPGRVVFGAGAARTALAGEVARLGVSRLLLIARGGRSSRSPANWPRRWRTGSPGRSPGSGRTCRWRWPDAARKQAAAIGADAVLSVGGGSATGTAKAVALTTGLPVIAVPTTYAGSEVTPVWGLTEGERKTTGVDARVLPRLVIYDPELTVSLPGPLSAASGLNAMAHCVEAFWAPGRNPVSALAAAEAIRVLAAALPAVAPGRRGPRRPRRPAVRGVPGRHRVRGDRLRPASQDLPRPGRPVRPAARADPRDHAAVRAGLQRARGAGRGQPDRPGPGGRRAPIRRPRCRRSPGSWACPAGCARSGWARTRSPRRPG